MIDLLLILSTLALLVLTHLMRTLLALRIPAEMRLKPAKLKQAPDIMADLFEQTDQALSDLGFSHGYWATVRTTPPLPGFTPPLIRLYHHKSKPIIARVSPPHSIFSTDRCQVVFLSISKRKTFLATANLVPELFPRPPQERMILLNTRVDTVAEQFRAHIQEMAQQELTWLDRSEERGEAVWVFRLANRYEAKSIQWLNENECVRRLEDGSAVPRIGIVLNFISRLATGQVRSPPKERSALPANRAAYLFQNWQQTTRLPPPLSTQLGLFLGSAIAFILLAGLFWDWTIALLLLGVIGFHEAGHWLAMRVLGYRNLQIIMLPLVGGVTLGQETGYNASHRILVSLMGPLPGIVLGTIILWFDGMEGGLTTMLGITLLVVNYLNLLPVMPLDGGQLLKALIPVRRFDLLITLEWLGTAALLLLGWLTDSLFLAALSLLPFIGGLALMKRKKVLDSLEEITAGSEQPLPNDRVAAVIQAIDENDKSYRPLEKKAQEIAEILTTLRLKPATAPVAGAFLSIYIATFLLPPIAVFIASPGIQGITTLLFSDLETVRQEAFERAMALPMSQLVTELSALHGSPADPSQPQDGRDATMQPAAGSAITLAEERLGTRFDEAHRQFLETSNGFFELNSIDETGYLLFPAEKIVRFGQILPQIVNRLRTETRSDTPPLVNILSASATEDTEAQVLNINQIAHMLVIGNPHKREYLLLDPVHQPDSPAPLLIVYETPGNLQGRRFESLRHYLADDLSMAQAMNLYQDSAE
jgi:Zn-dependent protease